LVDLTESNPTRVALADDQRQRWVSRLGDPAGGRYAPDARGLAPLREAIARYYGRRDRVVDPQRMVVTASSSEAYAWLFKLLGDPGDAILAPEPSYPLFPFLADLEDLRLLPYPLRRDEDWRVDLGALRRQLDEAPRARAILVVHPGNPTGSLLRQDDAEELATLARERGIALVVDEVFVDYLAPDRPTNRRGSFAGFGEDHDVTCFTLSGLSKVALLPQVKLGWLLAEGPGACEALARLELVADSYLSVNTAVQLAAPAILDEVDALQARLRERLARNLASLDAALADGGPSCPVRRLWRDGGWYAMLEVPRTRDDDAWIARLIEAEGIVVHPGYFFDAAEAGLMVVSLLLEPAVFAPAIQAAVARFAEG
jgi:aspartate/methionine/tyrosine aminotransferase